MKTIKIIILTTLLVMLCGCEPDVNSEKNLITYCDKEYGIEYIRDIGVYRGGITIRLNEKGEVIHCGN